MATEVSALRPAEDQPPTSPFCEPWLRNLRRGMGWVAGKPALMSGFSISPATHREIEVRRSTLARAITAGPRDRQAVGVEVAKLLTAFPTQDPGVTALARVDAYSDALGDAPAWAVREARLRVVRGDVVIDGAPLDKRFAPTPPQLASLVRAIVKPLRDDLHDLHALAMIPADHEQSAEERARVAQGLDELAASLGRPSPAAMRASAIDVLATRARALGIDPGVVDTIPDAPERTGTWGKLAAAVD